MAIPNKYKNILDDLIDSLDIKSLDQPESLDWLEPIDKGICNTLKFRSASPSLLEEDCLDENILVTVLERTPKIRDFQVYKYHDVVFFSPKSRRV